MNEELRMQRVRQHGSFLFCPARDVLCFGRYTDLECKYESCILDDPEYQALQKKIMANQKKRRAEAQERAGRNAEDPPAQPRTQRKTREDVAWEEVHAIEEKAQELYHRNKPKLADGMMAKAMYMRRKMAAERRGGGTR